MNTCFRWEAGHYPGLEERARQWVSQVQRYPDRRVLRQLAAPSLQQKSPARELAQRLRELWRQIGEVVWLEPLHVTSANLGIFTLLTNRHYRVRVVMTLEVDPPHRIASVATFPVQLAPDLSGAVQALGGLPGFTGLDCWRLAPGPPRRLLAAREDVPLSIASGFKLYVLAAVARAVELGELSWTDPLVLGDEHRAFPSGMLHDWPEASPLNVQTAATMMISVSDNTATEMLMRHLGDERLEPILAETGHHRPAEMTPLMSAMDLMRMTQERGRAEVYVASDAGERRRILEALRGGGRSGIGLSPVPRLLKAHWRATPADLCRVLRWLWEHSQTGPVRSILGVNPVMLMPTSRWRYMGFKGGGQAGVVSTSFLAQDYTGGWYAIAGIWNRPDEVISDQSLIDVLETLFWCLPRNSLGPPAGPALPFTHHPNPHFIERWMPW